MSDQSPEGFQVLAQAFAYPAPGRLAELERGLAELPKGPMKSACAAFLAGVRPLSLGQWEELHTRTLDLNPPAAPYVGYQMWGESYARGTFLARMSRELQVAAVDTGGELPDHLAPILSYLGRTPQPLPELVELLDPALERMAVALRRAEPENPYLELLSAIRIQCAGLKQEAT